MASRRSTHAKFDYSTKLLLLGDSGVGKSCLLQMYAEKEFSSSFITTIGIDYKTVFMADKDGKRIKMQIWDTAGQERFRTITTAYLRGAQGVLLVFDVGDVDSFEDVRHWIAHLSRHASDEAVRVIVGNKCDREDRVISTAQGMALAKDYGLEYFETSAKLNVNVREVFEHMGSMVRRSQDSRRIELDKPKPLDLHADNKRAEESSRCVSVCKTS